MQLGWRRRSPKGVVQPDMNVTPLVDVVLVLLIIFMVVAPRMDQDVQVELPGIFNPDPEVKMQVDPLKLSVAKKGEYYINEQMYDIDAAIDMLSAEHAADPYRRLVLRADAHLTYGDVRDILARAQKVGFPGMALMVGERHKPGEAPNGGTAATDGTGGAEAHPAAAAQGDTGSMKSEG